MLDGLDAHRSRPSWLADLVDELRGTRWRVIASIRQFDLDHSPRWQHLFPASPALPASKGGPLRDQICHSVIPGFDDRELSEITGASPSLSSVLAAGNRRLRDLLRNPFNMSITAELITPVGIAKLAAISTQVQILAAYWQARVGNGPGSYERSFAAQGIVEQMTKARSLEVVPRSAAGAVEELVSCGVLEEASSGRLVTLAGPVRFRHHIVFDFALAATLLGQPGTKLSDVLAADPDFVSVRKTGDRLPPRGSVACRPGPEQFLGHGPLAGGEKQPARDSGGSRDSRAAGEVTGRLPPPHCSRSHGPR